MLRRNCDEWNHTRRLKPLRTNDCLTAFLSHSFWHCFGGGGAGVDYVQDKVRPGTGREGALGYERYAAGAGMRRSGLFQTGRVSGMLRLPMDEFMNVLVACKTDTIAPHIPVLHRDIPFILNIIHPSLISNRSAPIRSHNTMITHRAEGVRYLTSGPLCSG